MSDIKVCTNNEYNDIGYSGGFWYAAEAKWLKIDIAAVSPNSYANRDKASFFVIDLRSVNEYDQRAMIGKLSVSNEHPLFPALKDKKASAEEIVKLFLSLLSIDQLLTIMQNIHDRGFQEGANTLRQDLRKLLGFSKYSF